MRVRATRRIFTSRWNKDVGFMAERKRIKLNKCPVCGGALYTDMLYQFSIYRRIGKNGKESKDFERGAEGSMDDKRAIICENGDFQTDYMMEVIKPSGKRWEIETDNGVFYLQEKPKWKL